MSKQNLEFDKDYARGEEMELRKYTCPKCHNKMWVDCDDTDYPLYCAFCGESQYEEDNHVNYWIKSSHTYTLMQGGKKVETDI